MKAFRKMDSGIDALAARLGEGGSRTLFKALLYLLLVSFVVWVPYSLIRHVHTSGFHVVSVAREAQVGREAAEKMEAQMDIMNEEGPLLRYVSDVGSRIARRHNPWGADFRFHVIADGKMVNAFALPGGRIYITTGLLERLDNEAELAMVLGHEVAHVSRRHYARNLGRQMLLSWVRRFLGGTDEMMLKAGSFLTANVAFLRMRQEDEIEADYYGTYYIFDLEYDPEASVSLIEKLLQMEREMPENMRFFAMTHPPSRERLEAASELAGSLPRKEELILGAQRYKDNLR